MIGLALPTIKFTRASMKADRDGFYFYEGSGACAMTVADGSIQLINGIETAGLRFIKNKASAAVNVTITATLYDTAAAATVVLTPGQGVWLKWDNTHWSTIAKVN